MHDNLIRVVSNHARARGSSQNCAFEFTARARFKSEIELAQSAQQVQVRICLHCVKSSGLQALEITERGPNRIGPSLNLVPIIGIQRRAERLGGFGQSGLKF